MQKIFNEDWDQSRFDVFEYSRVGLQIAGLMALKEKQKLVGLNNITWDDLLDEWYVPT